MADWSREEVEATISDYLEMLGAELSGARARCDDVYGFGTAGRATLVNPKIEFPASEGEAPTQGRPA